MALPASGQISMSQVNTELGSSATAQISLNDAAVRSLAGVSSGAISLDNLHGKSSAFAATISTNQLNLNLRTWALANGWNGSSAATITIASGVYIWANSTSTAALTISGSWPGGISLVNNGFIMGQGGTCLTDAGTNGGPAISLGVSVSINSSASYIGGGGGGGSGFALFGQIRASGGGGAGGGNGGIYPLGGSGSVAYQGYGGAVGAAGSSATGTGGTASNGQGGGAGGGGGSGYNFYANGGGGGGRIMPGVGGAGGTGTASGSGGSASAAGGVGSSVGSGGGGGWGASGGASGYAPGAGGNAVALNGYSVTWVGGFPSAYIFGAVS